MFEKFLVEDRLISDTTKLGIKVINRLRVLVFSGEDDMF